MKMRNAFIDGMLQGHFFSPAGNNRTELHLFLGFISFFLMRNLTYASNYLWIDLFHFMFALYSCTSLMLMWDKFCMCYLTQALHFMKLAMLL